MPTPWHDEGPDEVYDLASQLERTMMSWQRTALALGLNGALLLQLAATDQRPSGCGPRPSAPTGDSAVAGPGMSFSYAAQPWWPLSA